VNDVERLWNLHRYAIVDACHFGIAIAADHPHDTVADRKAGDRGTDSDNFPAISKPISVEYPDGRNRLGAGSGRHGSGPRRERGPKDRPPPQFGFGYLGDLQDVGVAKSSNRIGFMIRSPGSDG
jgi:hypothetical protein